MLLGHFGELSLQRADYEGNMFAPIQKADSRDLEVSKLLWTTWTSLVCTPSLSFQVVAQVAARLGITWYDVGSLRSSGIAGCDVGGSRICLPGLECLWSQLLAVDVPGYRNPSGGGVSPKPDVFAQDFFCGLLAVELEGLQVLNESALDVPMLKALIETALDVPMPKVLNESAVDGPMPKVLMETALDVPRPKVLNEPALDVPMLMPMVLIESALGVPTPRAHRVCRGHADADAQGRSPPWTCPCQRC